MTIFEGVLNPNDNDDLKELYSEITDNGFGNKVPINWFTSQSLRPDILQSTWDLTRGVLVNGDLPPTLKQLIAVTVSRHNNCRYCTVTHTGALEALGVPQKTVDSCINDPDLNDVPVQYRDILLFALKTSRDPNSLEESDFDTLRENGLSDGEIMEVVMMVAFTNFINTWADAAKVEVD